MYYKKKWELLMYGYAFGWLFPLMNYHILSESDSMVYRTVGL